MANVIELRGDVSGVRVNSGKLELRRAEQGWGLPGCGFAWGWCVRMETCAGMGNAWRCGYANGISSLLVV